MPDEDTLIDVVAARQTGEYKLTVSFSDGTAQLIDFEPFLQRSNNPLIRKYLSPDNFSNFRVEDGKLIWDDYGLCFPVGDLYENQIQATIHPLTPRHSVEADLDFGSPSELANSLRKTTYGLERRLRELGMNSAKEIDSLYQIRARLDTVQRLPNEEEIRDIEESLYTIIEFFPLVRTAYFQMTQEELLGHLSARMEFLREKERAGLLNETEKAEFGYWSRFKKLEDVFEIKTDSSDFRALMSLREKMKSGGKGTF